MGTIDTSRTYRLVERVLLKEDGDDILAFDPETLAVHKFNESLALIANAFDGNTSCEEIVLRVAENYGMEIPVASQEVYRALELLVEHDLLTHVE